MRQDYPKCLYHKTLPPCVVNDLQEHLEKGPGWHQHPNDVLKEDDPGKPPAELIPTPEPAAETDPRPLTPEAAADLRDQADADSLYKTKADTIIEKLKGCSVDALKRIQLLEAQNPRGARKSVLTAVEALLKAADAPATT